TGPGGTVLVAGGKYTTHRTMAQEIVEFALHRNQVLHERQKMLFSTKNVVNPRVTPVELQRARDNPRSVEVEKELWDRYGAEALEILIIDDELKKRQRSQQVSPEGFPRLEAQLRFSIRQGMVVRLEDFYFRRLPLFFARADHGLPWADTLALAWAEELGKSDSDAKAEANRLREECSRREQWRGAFR
ncbi:hypothetical protein EBZ37_05110, partial [bacterium]|nr:hypothetical protein [bacterium]